MTIRALRDPQDREALRACIIGLQEYERTLEPTLPEGSAMVDDYYCLLVDRCRQWQGHILLAQVNDDVAGFVCVLTTVPPAEPDDARESHAYVSDLFVHGQYRGQGIGRAMLQEAEVLARASGVRTIRIGVLARNRVARELYERQGFEPYHVQLVKPL